MAQLRTENPTAVAQLEEDAAKVLNGEGIFWQVDFPGTAPSYLFGTFHTPDAVDTVPEAVWRALDNATTAVFELTPDESAAMEARMASDTSFVIDQESEVFAEIKDPDDLDLVIATFEDRGVHPDMAGILRPWVQISLLSFPPCHLLAVSTGAKPLDEVMSERAAERGIAVVGLETYQQALASLNTLSAPDVAKLLISAGRGREHEENLFHTNMMLYAEGRIALLNEFNIWFADQAVPEFDPRALNDRLMSGLLDKRNEAWMAGLAVPLQRGGAFIAVGALHLSGETGLIELLRREGFTVSRIDG
ncbi:MAG: TraB/GumN family protein [Pseudomonadota bacterium]